MKFCQQLPGWFSLRTSYKVLIWCANHPNVHIHTFWKDWTFIWGYFFPVSILNGFYGAREFYRMTGCKELLKFVSRIFFIKTSYRENRSLFINQKLCWGFRIRGSGIKESPLTLQIDVLLLITFSYCRLLKLVFFDLWPYSNT